MSYGISVTTLEEVFLSVGHGLETKDKKGSPETALEKSEEKETEKDGDYSIGNNPTTGFSCTLMIEQFFAIIKRRLQVYRKNNALLYEILVPVLLMCVGLAFSKVNFFIDSPQRLLQPDGYPLKQDILYNTQLLKTSGNDIQPAKLMMSLPDQKDSFNLI